MFVDATTMNPYMITCNQLSLSDEMIPGNTYEERVIRWYEFELITESKGGYVIYKDHRIPAKPGMLMIRKPGNIAQGVMPYGCYTLAFDSIYEENMNPYYSENVFDSASLEIAAHMAGRPCPFLDRLPEVVAISEHIKLKALFDEAMQLYFEQPEDYTFLNRQIMYQILKTVLVEWRLQEKAESKQQRSAYREIDKTFSWIEKHYSEAITLERLSQMAGYSREAYSRLFRRNYGKSPIDYLIERRLIEAKKLLMLSNEPIELIAHRCGFNSAIHFHTSFKKREGLPPGKYRQNHQRKLEI